MNRRNFLKVAGIGSFGLAAGCVTSAEKTGNRPNILFCLADDWGWPHASCLGDSVIKTPAFDRIVKEGVLFRNAHCAAPSCSPSRAAILTGQWPWRLGDGANLRGSMDKRFKVYPDLLEKAGYYVGMTWKGYAPGLADGWERNPAGDRYKSFEDFLTKRPSGKPFCFWLGSGHPHRPYESGCGIKSGMDPARVVVPPYLPDSPEVRSDICDYYYKAQLFDQQCAKAVAAVESLGEMENTIIVITGDNGWPFPRSKATNYDSGTHQALAIRWGARVKGGRTVTDFVSLADIAPTFLEAADVPMPGEMTARSLMPVLLSDISGRVDPGRDHVLTCMETHAFCRESEDGEFIGYPRRTIITEDFHYIRNFHPERWPAGDPEGFEVPGAQPVPLEALGRNTFAAFGDIDASPSKMWLIKHRDEAAVKALAEGAIGKKPSRELYDLKKDPFELKNLAQDPAYADVVNKMDERLMDELRSTGDPRASGKGDEFESYVQPDKENAKLRRRKK